MGKVIVKLKLTNQADLVLKSRRLLKGRKPRTLEIEALVDTGATRLYLKPSVLRALGLRKSGTVNSRTTNGDRLRNVYEPVRLELMGRHGNFDVVDVDESVPNLLGQIPLGMAVRAGGDSGQPAVISDLPDAYAEVFRGVARQLAARISVMKYAGS